jgi:hypothetical protein
MTQKPNKGGRPPKESFDRTSRKTVTLRGRHIAAIEALQEGEEEFSTTLQRLLDSHPLVSTVIDWIEKTRKQTDD